MSAVYSMLDLYDLAREGTHTTRWKTVNGVDLCVVTEPGEVRLWVAGHPARGSVHVDVTEAGPKEFMAAVDEVTG